MPKNNVVRVGDVEIMMLSDGLLEFDLCNFFPTIPDEQWTPHDAHLTGEHKVRFNLGSYLIRTAGRTILVDTGLGPRPAETPDVPWGELLHDFSANGVRPDEVDMVVMTHLHRDHVGWNLLREGERWVPTFPKAKYWMSKVDWDTSHQPDVQPQRYPNAPTCVWPLEPLGLVEFMHGEHAITRELTALPTPGHTPGHVSILVTSQGQRALILGDAAHNPVQIEEPDWVSRADHGRGRPLPGARLRPDRAPRRPPLLARALIQEAWRRNVWALALSVFVAFVGFQFSSPFMPLYVRELGVTDPGRIALWSGLIAASTPAVSGLLGPFFGRLADRFGRKLMLIRSLVGFVVIIAIMGLVTSVEQLFLARLVQGLFAGFTPMAMALASVAAPRDKVPVAISIVQSAQLLSVAVGPAAGGYVASHHGIRAAFFVTAGMCVVALIALIFLFQEVSASGAPMRRGGAARLPMRQALRYPNFLLVLGLLLIAQFIDRGLALMIPLHVAHMPGLDAIAATSGAIISIAAVAATASSNVAARLARGIPTTKLLMVGLLAGGPLCAAMALAHGWPALLVLRTLVGLCFGGAITLAYALGAEIVPPEHRGAAFGWLALGVQVGTATSPLAMGALAAWSIPGAYVFDGAIALSGAALLAFGWGRTRPPLRDARS